jgi:hypothetical protein
MNGRCKQIQDILAESGATAFQDDGSAQLHLTDCEDCYAVLTAMSELDAALPALPIHDASDACVDALLARVSELPRPRAEAHLGIGGFARRLRDAARNVGEWHARVVASAAAVAVVSAAGVAIVVSMVGLETSHFVMDEPSASHFVMAEPSTTQLDSARVSRRVSRMDGANYRSSNESEHEVKKRSLKPDRDRFAAQQAPAPASDLRALGYIGDLSAAGRDSDEERLGLAIRAYADAAPPLAMEIAEGDIEEIVVSGEKTSSLVDAPTSSTSFSAGDLKALRIRDIPDLAEFAPNLEIDTAFEAESKLKDDEAPSSKREISPAAPPPPKSQSTDELAKRANAGWKEERAVDRKREAALGIRAFQEASGYWSNAYVPGDPAIRLLETRLDATDREMLQTYAAAPLQLHDRARQVQQPFDAPTEAAMEVFLHSDRTALEGAERLTLQVGLQGARRQGGTRPPMNIGVVLDLRGEVSAEHATQMRAIVDALRTAKEVGDRFSLRIAGRDCDSVESDRFEYGPLSVAMESCFGADSAPGKGQAIAAALESATHAVRVSDDPDAPLGSSMVLLVTSQTLAGELTALEAIGHESAVAGVPISVAGVGSGIALDEIDRLTLAGQGNRRLVTTPDEARNTVDRELSALSRAVARALRLRIRLAPGVKLIRILDASRLDDEGAERVREAEQSIDLRMASELGIEADRGEDEDGIQIVIPSFYAGGSHAILLDVVAPEAGPIADVTLRYKDLVFQRNGVARANLNLGGETKTVGPLERNVLKNVLSVRMSSALKNAGRALGEGRVEDAVHILDEQRERLVQMRAAEAAFQSDAELKADLNLLDEYLSLLRGEAVGLGGPRHYLANSLQLSGHFKTLPRTRVD